MTINNWLTKASGTLRDNSVPSARLDSLILLEDFTGRNRTWLLAHDELELADTKKIDEQILRRATHEPLAYIREKGEFYGRVFKVSVDTLQPRPETETLIELLLQLHEAHEFKTIIDIGTGSGCIAITAALETTNTNVLATETSVAALKIARQNAKILQANVSFFEGDLLSPVPDTACDVIATNLPYVPDGHTINEAARYEPRQAIFGGKDGLDLYRRLFEQINQREHKPTYILTESLPPQHANLAAIAHRSGYTQTNVQDFIQVFTQITPEELLRA